MEKNKNHIPASQPDSDSNKRKGSSLTGLFEIKKHKGNHFSDSLPKGSKEKTPEEIKLFVPDYLAYKEKREARDNELILLQDKELKNLTMVLREIQDSIYKMHNTSEGGVIALEINQVFSAIMLRLKPDEDAYACLMEVDSAFLPVVTRLSLLPKVGYKEKNFYESLFIATGLEMLLMENKDFPLDILHDNMMLIFNEIAIEITTRYEAEVNEMLGNLRKLAEKEQQ